MRLTLAERDIVEPIALPDGVIRTAMGVYVLRDDQLLSRWIENANALDIPYNVAEIASFAHVIPEDGVVIDAGACLGDHTLTYSQIVGAGGHVYAFEPHPLIRQALHRNMARLTNVTIEPYALSDQAGHGVLNLTPNIGASFVQTRTDQWPTAPIELVTLDAHLLPRLQRCDFIHLDAEGLEPKILHGARALIRRFRPALVVEVCDQWLRRYGSSESDFLAFLSELGYHVFPIHGQTNPAQRDVLAMRRA